AGHPAGHRHRQGNQPGNGRSARGDARRDGQGPRRAAHRQPRTGRRQPSLLRQGRQARQASPERGGAAGRDHPAGRPAGRRQGRRGRCPPARTVAGLSRAGDRDRAVRHRHRRAQRRGGARHDGPLLGRPRVQRADRRPGTPRRTHRQATGAARRPGHLRPPAGGDGRAAAPGLHPPGIPALRESRAGRRRQLRARRPRRIRLTVTGGHMNTIRTTLLTAMLVVLPLAGACSKQEPPAEAASAASETKGLIARTVEREIEKARKELTEGNISIGGDSISIKVNGKHYSGKENLPKAEITPQGELLIEGKPVATTPEQRALLLEYRGQVIGIAETGMVIGAKAADMAGAAITESLGAIFSGNTDAIEKKVEAEAEKIK